MKKYTMIPYPAFCTIICGIHKFNITRRSDTEFRVISSIATRFANSLDEAIHFCYEEIARDEEQCREWNAEFADSPEEQISLFRIPLEMQGLVNLDRMQFQNGVYVGNKPYTSEF